MNRLEAANAQTGIETPSYPAGTSAVSSGRLEAANAQTGIETSGLPESDAALDELEAANAQTGIETIVTRSWRGSSRRALEAANAQTGIETFWPSSGSRSIRCIRSSECSNGH